MKMKHKNMRAKMQIKVVENLGDDDGEILHFSAVSKENGYGIDGADENNTYARFTPSAEIKIHITNPNLLGKFKVGEFYYVDFTKAE